MKRSPLQLPPRNRRHRQVGESQTETLRLVMDDMRAELAALRTENNAGHAANASNTGKIARQLDDVTSQSGGDAVSVSFAA